eukprot:GHVQ01008578.1.p1 GENE.GHVQ01008578.1~~GHVQ01008578.1.p1  ORF type:complete len:276 (+),score=33.70 GHVQ01008578.1:260-1087(+)
MSLIPGAGNAGQVTPTYSGLRQVLRDQINDSQPKFIAKDISEDVVPERLDLEIWPRIRGSSTDTRRQWKKKKPRVFLQKTDRNKRDAIAPNNTSTETTPSNRPTTGDAATIEGNRPTTGDAATIEGNRPTMDVVLSTETPIEGNNGTTIHGQATPTDAATRSNGPTIDGQATTNDTATNSTVAAAVRHHTGRIVGGTLGALAAVLGLATSAYCWFKPKKHNPYTADVLYTATTFTDQEHQEPSSTVSLGVQGGYTSEANLLHNSGYDQPNVDGQY